MNFSVYFENLKIAWQAVRSQLLRTILTALIIALGITALVGMLTAIDSLKASLSGQFAMLGANTISIQNSGPQIQIGRGGKKPKRHPKITYRQATEFKEAFKSEPAITSISFLASPFTEIKYKSLKTNPNISLMAVDENYVQTAGYEIEEGRNITIPDVEGATPVALIGQEVVEKLFPATNPLGQIIQVQNVRLKVVGVLKEKGSAMGFGGDKSVFAPISKVRSVSQAINQSYTANIMALQSNLLEHVTANAAKTMRNVRRQQPKEEDNFNITRSDNLSQMLIENLSFVSLAALLIAAITILGAAIALMNIMMVSVTERTREIGIRKAIGAKAGSILSQFLTEAIFICFIGGFVGVLLGMLIGNITASLIGGAFIIPWKWIFGSFALCFFTGLISGLYPAYKASKLDPIESLRYE